MKKILFMAFALFSVFSIGAQNTYTGTVVDKKGYPVPGARVGNAKGAQTAYTDMNGRFRLNSETPIKQLEVAYPGYQTAKEKTHADMVVTLGTASKWGAPTRYQWFLGVTATTPNIFISSFKQPENIAWGLRFGCLKNWGFYGNVSSSLHFDYHGDGDLREHGNNFGYRVKPDYSTLIGSVGVIRRLWSPLHIYVGAGYLYSTCSYDLQYAYHDYSDNCVSYRDHHFYPEAGLMLRLRNVMLEAGVKGRWWDYSSGYGNYWRPDTRDQREVRWTVGINYLF